MEEAFREMGKWLNDPGDKNDGLVFMSRLHRIKPPVLLPGRFGSNGLDLRDPSRKTSREQCFVCSSLHRC